MQEGFSIRGDLQNNAELRLQGGQIILEQDGKKKTWNLKEFSKIRLEHLVGSLVLLGTEAESGQDVVLLRGSLGQARLYQRFAAQATSEITGKPVEERGRENEDMCPKCGRLYPDPARPICPKCLDRRSLTKRVIGLTPPYLGSIVLIIVLMLLSSLVGLLPPYLSGRVFYDQVIAGEGPLAGRIGLVVLMIFGSQLLVLLINIAQGRVNSKVAAQIAHDLKTQVFTAMQRLSLKFFNNQQTGSLMTRVNNDANHLQYFFHDGVPYFVVNCMRIIGVVAVLLAMDWQLACMVLIPVPLIVLAFVKIRPILWRMYTKRWRASSRLNSIINDSLSGMRVIKAFGTEDEEIQRFSRGNRRVARVNQQVGNLTSTVFPAISYFMSLGALVIWGYGGWRVAHGQMTFGSLIAFTGYLGMLYGPLDFMTNVVEWWSSSMNSAQRIFEIIDSQEILYKPEQPVPMPEIIGAVEAENVTFGYEEGKPVLENISFKVEPGEMIGLVGRSGSGKSTLINLIARLYDPDQGRIFLDGIDLREIDEKDLRRQIGMVLQETFLFRGTIYENIAYAKPGATPEEVIRAAKIANAHDFITELPDGYETVLGERDINLSGGERQRIAIARAVLHNPRILILDEATSAIDTETERLVQEAIERLVEGRTTFVIAHRLSTLRKADRLFVIDKGQLKEVGTHAELLKSKGIYYKLFTTQRKALARAGVAS